MSLAVFVCAEKLVFVAQEIPEFIQVCGLQRVEFKVFTSVEFPSCHQAEQNLIVLGSGFCEVLCIQKSLEYCKSGT